MNTLPWIRFVKNHLKGPRLYFSCIPLMWNTEFIFQQKQKRSFKEIASMFEFIVVYFPLLLIVVLGLGFAIWFLLTLRKKPDDDFEEDETWLASGLVWFQYKPNSNTGIKNNHANGINHHQSGKRRDQGYGFFKILQFETWW